MTCESPMGWRLKPEPCPFMSGNLRLALYRVDCSESSDCEWILYQLFLIVECALVFGFAASVTEVLAPSASGASAEAVNSPNLHDLQVYGVLVTVVLCLIVFGGVKMINKVAPTFLIPVLVSVLLIFIGMFAARKHEGSGETFFLHILKCSCCWKSSHFILRSWLLFLLLVAYIRYHRLEVQYFKK